MWLFLSILSALFLGCYDVFKKQSLKCNEVVPVLTGSILVSCVILTIPLLFSSLYPDLNDSLWYVPKVPLGTHIWIFLKSVLVLSSWLLAYFAMKNLPITIVSPVNATRPIWTLLGALLIFGETLNTWQSVGILFILCSFFAFSVIGKKEGISFFHNRWIVSLLLAMFLGAASGLYDKYLMRHYDHNAVQVYYTYYQALMMLVICSVWYLRHRNTIRFKWQWSIVLISVFLVASDFVYLLALTFSGSLLAVVSTVRRAGVIVPFVYGTVVLKEQNPKLKALCLLGILAGMILLAIGTI
ncbi:MAG: EamA family transporter [Paludibacteraceae bacterium]|nr:EamA family transporter [Paludibacteraceae bacterium]